jgi:hypothetical protein
MMALFMLGAPRNANAVHLRVEDAKDWSPPVPLRSMGTQGVVEVCAAPSHITPAPCHVRVHVAWVLTSSWLLVLTCGQVVGNSGAMYQFVVNSRPITAFGGAFSRTMLLEVSPRFVIINQMRDMVHVQQAGALCVRVVS